MKSFAGMIFLIVGFVQFLSAQTEDIKLNQVGYFLKVNASAILNW